MGRHRKQPPARCPDCGALVTEWPDESTVCYGCLIGVRRLVSETKKEVSMIVIHAATQTIGKMLSSGAGLVRFDIAGRRELLHLGQWTFDGEEATFPKHECRFFLKREAAEKVLRELAEVQ